MQAFPGELTFITEVALLFYFFHIYAKNTKNSSIKKKKLFIFYLFKFQLCFKYLCTACEFIRSDCSSYISIIRKANHYI